MKKYLITLMTAIITVVSMSAQFPNISFFSSNQQLVLDAVSGGIIIVKQSYQLQDTINNKHYGRFGRNEFGTTYSIAVKVEGGLILSDMVARPWDYDSNFNRYRDSLNPVNIDAKYVELNDSVFKSINLDYAKIYNADSAAFYMLNDTIVFGGNGFVCKKAIGLQKGWLVWITSDEQIDRSDSVNNNEYVIFGKDLEISGDSVSYAIQQPLIDRNIWGGVYVVPEQTEIGQLTFQLIGIFEMVDGKWRLFPLPNNEEIPQALDELTPADSNDRTRNRRRR